MIYALPSSIRTYTERVELALGKWPIHVTIDRAIKWILQFDVNDYPLAIRIIENLDILGPLDVRAGLEVAHAKLNRKAAEKNSLINGKNRLFPKGGGLSVRIVYAIFLNGGGSPQAI